MTATGIKTLRRATLCLVLLSCLQLLLIKNSALECATDADQLVDVAQRMVYSEDEGRNRQWNQQQQQQEEEEEEEEKRQRPATEAAVTSGHRHWYGAAAEVVRRFVRIAKTAKPLQPFCNQAYSNASYQASVLAIGSMEFSTHPDQMELLTQATASLPQADWIISTLVTPLSWDESPTIAQALKSLRASGVQLMSLATERMHSEEEGVVKTTTHYLDEAGIHWVGLSLKGDDIIVLNGVRVGFLAFCAVYKECMESDRHDPFSPIKYTAKVAAKAVNTLKAHGVDVIVVKVRWGRGGSYYPDETALVTTRYLASLGVTLIIGDHPTLQQDHAYFENTLVIFSTGTFSRPSNSPQFCWQQTSKEIMEYSKHNHCRSVHPNLRSSLKISEHHTAFYHIQLSRTSPVVAEYASVPLSEQGSGVELPDPASLTALEWTRVCGRKDTHCLVCDSL